MQRENFELEMVKLTKGGGLELQFNEATENGKNKSHLTINEEPHADLRGLFRELREVLMQVLCIAPYNEEDVRPNLLKKTKKGAIIIGGEFETLNTLIAKLQTPRINLENNIFGIEDKLERIAMDMEDEVYLFTQGKRDEMCEFN